MSLPEKRYFDRQELDPLDIQGLISISDLTPIADGGYLVEASVSGFRLEIHRDELCDPVLREHLTLEEVEGCQVSIFIPAMDLDVTGIITRTKYKGDGVFEIGIDYTSDAPEYWRECLCDLLPKPGELSS
ncbi:MAG: hypothetical protein HRT44_00460 [Bdellovibrionales bacterium]|nr:hypothetical protein [Bdellovibrionales bacterium]NQZ17724.1 hypothetical protein [Bdellovibrionales bacterium]